MSHIIGLGIIMLWSLGYLFPYTLFGFIEILMTISLSIFLLNKVAKMVFLKQLRKAKFIKEDYNVHNE
jgi:hypothetical protein